MFFHYARIKDRNKKSEDHILESPLEICRNQRVLFELNSRELAECSLTNKRPRKYFRSELKKSKSYNLKNRSRSYNYEKNIEDPGEIMRKLKIAASYLNVKEKTLLFMRMNLFKLTNNVCTELTPAIMIILFLIISDLNNSKNKIVKFKIIT